MMRYFNTRVETFESILNYNSLHNNVYHQTHCKAMKTNHLKPRNFASVLSAAGFTSNHRDVTQSASEDSASVTSVLTVSASLFCRSAFTSASSRLNKMVMARPEPFFFEVFFGASPAHWHLGSQLEPEQRGFVNMDVAWCDCYLMAVYALATSAKQVPSAGENAAVRYQHSTCRKTLPLSIGPRIRNLTGSGPQHIKIPFWFWNLGDAIEATKSLAGLQCTGNNQRKMTISCKVVPPAKTNEKLAWWNGELPVRYTVGIPATPSHEEVSSPAPQGNWCEIWRKVMLTLHTLHTLHTMLHLRFFGATFRNFSHLQSAIQLPILASIIFMGLLLANRARYCRQWLLNPSGDPRLIKVCLASLIHSSGTFSSHQKADGSSWQLLA